MEAVTGSLGGFGGVGGDALPLGSNDLDSSTPQAAAPAVPSGGLGVSQF